MSWSCRIGTALRDVPCDAGGMPGIRVIWSHLSVYRHCPEDNDGQVGDGAEEWVPDV